MSTRWSVVASVAFSFSAWLGVAAPAFAQGAFAVTSKDLAPDKAVGLQHVYDHDGCNGKNISPQLRWSGVPAGTKSFAVTMFDPDAPGPAGWWHWAVAEIPADVRELPSNASASGFLKRMHAVEASNDFGTPGYGGPCPPQGQTHRYIVTVYALGTSDLRLAPGQPAPMFDHEIGTSILGKASITVKYGR
jgi:Raf kinase inhibitor-like YbhB/YbcL family protein